MSGRGRVVLDSDVVRFALTHQTFREQVIAEFPLWSLSAVVAHEIRRAARGLAKQHVDDLIRRIPQRIDPAWSDWMTSAEYLAHLGERSGFDSGSVPRHQNDCLIAASAWRNGLPIVTCNRVDFERIATFMKAKAGQLIVLSAPK